MTRMKATYREFFRVGLGILGEIRKIALQEDAATKLVAYLRYLAVAIWYRRTAEGKAGIRFHMAWETVGGKDADEYLRLRQWWFSAGMPEPCEDFITSHQDRPRFWSPRHGCIDHKGVL